MHCLVGSLLWPEILGGSIFLSKKSLCKKYEHVFWRNLAFLPVPNESYRLIKPLLKNSFSTNFQGTGPWEGPIHFSRFVLRAHNCSKLFQSWSWRQEKKEKPFTQAIAKFKAQTFPKRIRPLIKPLLKNSFSTSFQGTGPWEGPIHFSRFVLRAHNCSTLFQSWSWSQEKKETPFPQAFAKFKTQTFPKRIRPLIKPLLKNSFSTNFQGTGPWEGPIHFSRFVLRVHNCSSFSRADPGAKRRKNRLLQKQSVLSPSLSLSMFLSLSLILTYPFSFSSSSTSSFSSYSSSSSSSSSLFLSFSFSRSLSLFFLFLFLL